MLRVSRSIPIAVLTLLLGCLSNAGAWAQSSAAPVKLRYTFTKGQKRTYTVRESSIDRTQQAPAFGMEEEQSSNWNGIVLEVTEVAPDGSADFKFSFDFMRVSKSLGPGLLFVIDSRQPIRASNPNLVEAGPEAESFLNMLEITHRIINAVFIKDPLRFNVSNRGRITRVTGLEEVWDRYRVEAGKFVKDPAKRSEMDAVIEGLFGEKAIIKTLADNFFIPLPENAVARGQEWTDTFTYEIGAIHLPVKKTYRLETEPAPLPFAVTVTLEFGDPPPTEEVVLRITRNLVEGVMTVDLQNGFISDWQYGGHLELESREPGPAHDLLARIVMAIDGSIVSRLWTGDRAPQGEETTFFDEGVGHFREGRYFQAIVSFNQAIAMQPDWAEPYERVGLAYTLMARENEAIEAFKHAIRLDPKRAETFQNLGAAYNQADRFREAIEPLKKSIGMDPKQVQAYLELGESYRQLDRCDEAVEVYKEAARLDPQDGGAHLFMGGCYRELGKIEDAIRELREATRLEPENAGGYFILAGAYAGADRKEDAIASFKQAIALDSKSVRIRTGLGHYYFDLERYSDAVVLLQEVIRIDPQYVDARVGLAMSYFKLGQKDLALEAARELEPLDPSAAEMIQRAIAP